MEQKPKQVSVFQAEEQLYLQITARIEALEKRVDKWEGVLNNLITIAGKVTPTKTTEPTVLRPEQQQPQAEPLRATQHWSVPTKATQPGNPTIKKSSPGKWILFTMLILLIVGAIYMFYLYNNGYIFFWQQ